jgi:prevent-host-death family protein
VFKTAINVHAAKTQFSKLLERVEAGEEIVIARGGKPVARLAPLRGVRREVRKPGMLVGRVHIAVDFDAPLPDGVMASFLDTPLEPPRKRRRG